MGVNRDASLFCPAPDSGLVARRGGVAPPGRSGSAARRIDASSGGPDRRSLRHSKSGHGRNSCRSQPACGRLRRGTAAPTPPRHGMAEYQVDLRNVCRDIDPACVPGTVWGTASSQTAKFRSRRRACLLIPARSQPASRCRVSRWRCSPAGNGGDQRDARHSRDFTHPLRTHRTSGCRRHFRPLDSSRRINADSGRHRQQALYSMMVWRSRCLTW